MNSICVHGNLTKDAEVIKTTNGLFIIKGTLADNVGYGEKRSVNWFQFTRFTKTEPSETFMSRLKKGALVIVHGHVEVNERKTEDKTYTNLEIITTHIESFNTAPSADTGAKTAPAAKKAETKAETTEIAPTPEQEEEELPF